VKAGNHITIRLSREDRRRIISLIRTGKATRRQRTRLRIIVLASQRLSNARIAFRLGLHRKSIGLWRQRFLNGGIDALLCDAPRRGRNQTIVDDVQAEIVRVAREERDVDGKSWRLRSLAARFKLGNSVISRILHAHGIFFGKDAPQQRPRIKADVRAQIIRAGQEEGTGPGGSSWSAQTLSAHLGISSRAVVMIWRSNGIARGSKPTPQPIPETVRSGVITLTLDGSRGPDGQPWHQKTLATRFDISPTSVSRIWKANRISRRRGAAEMVSQGT